MKSDYILFYLQSCVHFHLCRFKSFASDSKYLQMDASVLRNLEIFHSNMGSQKGSLFWALDHTRTKFGSR